MMATLITDAFTRADSATVPGSPSAGGPYTVRLGTWGISSNQLYPVTSTANAHLTFPAAIDFDISVTMNVVGATCGIIGRWIDASNYWLLAVSTTPLLSIQRSVAGTFQIESGIYTLPTPPYTIRFVGRGRYLYGYVGSVLVAITEDFAYPSATTTCGLRCTANTTSRFDDLSGVDSSALSSGTFKEVTPLNLPSTVPQTRGAHILKGRDRKSLDTTSAA